MIILLVNPPWTRLFGRELWQYPIGLSYLAAALEKEGHKTIVYNADFERGKVRVPSARSLTKAHHQYMHALHDLEMPIWKEVSRVVSRFSPDMVGITIGTPQYGSALNVAKLVKKVDPTITVVAGGPHPTALPSEVVQNENFDIVVRSEGELTLPDLAQKIQENKLDKVLGITYKKDGKPIHNPDRSLVQNLDILPFPARHLVLYKEIYPPNAFGPMFTSRGCPFGCVFCASNKIWGKKVRFRSPVNVIDEIRYVMDKFKTKWFRFEDDTFNLNRKRTMEICRLIKQERLDITWWCELRVGASLLDEHVVREMKEAGCREVSIGVESGDANMLMKMKKGITVEEALAAAKIFKKYGIAVNAFFMLGFPWETKNEITKTMSLMRQIDPDNAVYSIATPYPGTELFEIVRKEGLMPMNMDWSFFFHQSPTMFLTKNFSRDEVTRIIEETQEIFESHNKIKIRKRMFDLRYLWRRFVREGYYTNPSWLLSYLRDLI